MMFLVLQLVPEDLGFQLAQLLRVIPEIQNTKLLADTFFLVAIQTSLKSVKLNQKRRANLRI